MTVKAINSLALRYGAWADYSETISVLREAVFVNEQGIASEIVWDKRDEACRHYLLSDNEGNALAVARVDLDGKLGRMAVAPSYRNLGLGQLLLRYLLSAERALGRPSLYLHAQQTAVGFYKTAKFVCYGEIFYEARIPHQAMRLEL